MKKATWFIFLVCGILAGSFILLGRYIGIEYIKVFLIFIAYLVSGLIIRSYSVLHHRAVLLFLSPAFAAIAWGLINQSIAVSSSLVESIVLILGLNTGYYTRSLPGARKMYPVIFATLFVLVFASFINPRIIAATRFGALRHQIKAQKGQVIQFELEGLHGEKINSESLRGKTILLDCWFVNCDPCYDKLNYLLTLQDYYRKRQDVIIIAVASDKNADFTAFRKAVRDLPADILYAFDPGGQLSSQLNITGYPTELLIDSAGKLQDHFIGFNEDIALIYVPTTIKKIDRLAAKK